VIRAGLLLALIAGCGSSAPAGDDAGAPDLSPVLPFCTCGTGKSCLRAVVTRSSDTSKLPWVAFAANGADGVGNLIVSARPAGGGAVMRQAAFPVDAKPATINLHFDFGCVDLGSYTMGAFLDDNGNAADDAVSSADFLDACLSNRAPSATVRDAQVTSAPLQLASSCD
jgi:hypothetical protein